LVISGDGQEAGAYTESDAVTKRSNKVLKSDIIAALTDRKELRLDAETGYGAGMVDVTTTDTAVLDYFDNAQALGRRDGTQITTQ
jgi:hypothetical protein